MPVEAAHFSVKFREIAVARPDASRRVTDREDSAVPCGIQRRAVGNFASRREIFLRVPTGSSGRGAFFVPSRHGMARAPSLA